VGQRVWCASQGYDGRKGSFAELARVEEAHRLVEGMAPAARRMAGSCSSQMRRRPAASARPRACGLPASRR
jgi:hypothetical protein